MRKLCYLLAFLMALNVSAAVETRRGIEIVFDTLAEAQARADYRPGMTLTIRAGDPAGANAIYKVTAVTDGSYATSTFVLLAPVTGITAVTAVDLDELRATETIELTAHELIPPHSAIRFHLSTQTGSRAQLCTADFHSVLGISTNTIDVSAGQIVTVATAGQVLLRTSGTGQITQGSPLRCAAGGTGATIPVQETPFTMIGVASTSVTAGTDVRIWLQPTAMLAHWIKYFSQFSNISTLADTDEFLVAQGFTPAKNITVADLRLALATATTATNAVPGVQPGDAVDLPTIALSAADGERVYKNYGSGQLDNWFYEKQTNTWFRMPHSFTFETSPAATLGSIANTMQGDEAWDIDVATGDVCDHWIRTSNIWQRYPFRRCVADLTEAASEISLRKDELVMIASDSRYGGQTSLTRITAFGVDWTSAGRVTLLPTAHVTTALPTAADYSAGELVTVAGAALASGNGIFRNVAGASWERVAGEGVESVATLPAIAGYADGATLLLHSQGQTSLNGVYRNAAGTWEQVTDGLQSAAVVPFDLLTNLNGDNPAYSFTPLINGRYRMQVSCTGYRTVPGQSEFYLRLRFGGTGGTMIDARATRLYVDLIGTHMTYPTMYMNGDLIGGQQYTLTVDTSGGFANRDSNDSCAFYVHN